jgi:uncharacterized protein
MGLVALGLITGIFSGLVGLGGGALVIPSLIYFFGFSQHTAQGTSLAMMIPPIGILAAWTYYKHGYVDIKTSSILAIGFIVGGFMGSKLAILIPAVIMKKVVGLSLIGIGLRMLFF